MSECNKDIHEFLKKEMKKGNCDFCGECLIADSEIKRFVCCDSMNIVEDQSIRRCTNCFWFDYPYASEYISFHESKHLIMRKSIYRRDYRFLNVLRTKSLYFTREEEMELLRKFDGVVHLFGKMKRCIKFEYLIRKMLELKNDERCYHYEKPRCKRTLMRYEEIWNSSI